jgi:hypothetical protein
MLRHVLGVGPPWLGCRRGGKKPLETEVRELTAEEYAKASAAGATYDHFYEKLLRLKVRCSVSISTTTTTNTTHDNHHNRISIRKKCLHVCKFRRIERPVIVHKCIEKLGTKSHRR